MRVSSVPPAFVLVSFIFFDRNVNTSLTVPLKVKFSFAMNVVPLFHLSLWSAVEESAVGVPALLSRTVSVTFNVDEGALQSTPKFLVIVSLFPALSSASTVRIKYLSSSTESKETSHEFWLELNS